MAQLMPLPLTVSCFTKIQIGFTFLVPAHLGSPGKRPLNGWVCVCYMMNIQKVPSSRLWLYKRCCKVWADYWCDTDRHRRFRRAPVDSRRRRRTGAIRDDWCSDRADRRRDSPHTRLCLQSPTHSAFLHFFCLEIHSWARYTMQSKAELKWQ